MVDPDPFAGPFASHSARSDDDRADRVPISVATSDALPIETDSSVGLDVDVQLGTSGQCRRGTVAA